MIVGKRTRFRNLNSTKCQTLLQVAAILAVIKMQPVQRIEVCISHPLSASGVDQASDFGTF